MERFSATVSIGKLKQMQRTLAQRKAYACGHVFIFLRQNFETKSN